MAVDDKKSPPPVFPPMLSQPRDCNCGIGNLWPNVGHAPTCSFRVDLEAGR